MAMLTPNDLWYYVDQQQSTPYDAINNKFDELVSKSGSLHYDLYKAMQCGKDTIEIQKMIDVVGAEIDSLLFYIHI